MHTGREDSSGVLDFVFQECKVTGGFVGFRRKKKYRMTLSKRSGMKCGSQIGQEVRSLEE